MDTAAAVVVVVVGMEALWIVVADTVDKEWQSATWSGLDGAVLGPGLDSGQWT